MSLSDRSDEEISRLLADYGIKHGPIVDSTRKLYEKKLEKAMEGSAAEEEPSSDKTFYREEAEEVTFITYTHSPVRQEVFSGMVKRRGNTEPDEDEDSDQDAEPLIQSADRTANHSAVRSEEQVEQCGGGVCSLLRLLLLLALLAGVFYYTYCRLMGGQDSPAGVQ